MRYKEKRICYLVATIEDKKIVPKLQKTCKNSCNTLLCITLYDLNYYFNDTDYCNYEKDYNISDIYDYLIHGVKLIYTDNFGIDKFTDEAIKRFL